jgi:hypothetical protein
MAGGVAHALVLVSSVNGLHRSFLSVSPYPVIRPLITILEGSRPRGSLEGTVGSVTIHIYFLKPVLSPY